MEIKTYGRASIKQIVCRMLILKRWWKPKSIARMEKEAYPCEVYKNGTN